MPCVCQRCLDHSSTLGLAETAPTRASIRKAFRAAAKLWHPDRFENNPRARKQAEEHFKLVQVAYRELWEHHENPLRTDVEFVAEPRNASRPQTPVDSSFGTGSRVVAPPTISFSGAPGCFEVRDFPLQAHLIVASHLGDPENALAIVDLSTSASPGGSFSRYILFTIHGIFVRNSHGIVLLLWYSDLGDVQIVDRRWYGKLRFWHKLAKRLYAVQPKYSLLIYRRNKTLFCTFEEEMDDSVKKVVYNFLLRRKSEIRS